MPADPKRVRDLFLTLADLSTAERDALLDAECGDDDALRAEVTRLLAALERPASLLADSASQGATAPFEPLNERPGTTIGPYKLLEQIGEGGFGLVFVAEQSAPVRRRVALKVIKPGMDSKQVIS